MEPLREQLAHTTSVRIIEGCERLGISIPETEILIHKIANALPSKYIVLFREDFFKTQIIEKIASEFILFQAMENICDPAYVKHFEDFICILVYELGLICQN